MESKLSPATATRPIGSFSELEGLRAYRIEGAQHMAPFLVSLTSDSDRWMFLSSNGGLTAGRESTAQCLFPYATDDILHDAHHTTGPATVVRVVGSDQAWEPFAHPQDHRVERQLVKTIAGDRLAFIEHDEATGLRMSYRWAATRRLGFVRSCRLENGSALPLRLRLADGLRNLLPAGVPLSIQQQSSCLADAYKRSEVDPATGLGIFSLSSKIVDRPEAAEALRANVAWSTGLPGARVDLSGRALDAVREGTDFVEHGLRTGVRGHYIVHSELELAPGEAIEWHVVADAGASQVEVEATRALLVGTGVDATIDEALREAASGLRALIASADGIQDTGDEAATAHHEASVLFNCMRGGIFVAGYEVEGARVARFVRDRNRACHTTNRDWLAALPRTLTTGALVELAREHGDPDLVRLCLEYLPLSFGRRHGDPSRPWNRFNIRLREVDGRRALRYEGNWRDIFQNWEALALSFPGFLPHFIAKFLDASTMDGHNPYRISDEGIDWEIEDPEDPWSHIGYWGDHQLVYLLKLLELQERFAPGELASRLGEAIYSYANVPYRIAGYRQMLANPWSTIEFDQALHDELEAAMANRGADARLVSSPGGGVLHVTLAEKLLVPALAKLGNLVPGGGIWMNTQRPEWNDANNALAGLGLSVVTLCQLRSYLVFLRERLAAAPSGELVLSASVARWLRELDAALGTGALPPLGDARRPALAATMMDRLQEASEAHRERVYGAGPGEPTTVATAGVLQLVEHALLHVDQGVRENRRPDGLYHSYNLLERDEAGPEVHLGRLDPMLEGQVAALRCGLLGPRDAVELVEALYASELYRADQDSFMLYPVRVRPSFLRINMVPPDRALAIGLLQELLEAGDPRLVEYDAAGNLRFHADLSNAAAVAERLDDLATESEWAWAVDRDRQQVLALYEEVFQHHSFLGRSQSMYAYEGIGSIYWHMVGKLVLAVQEHARGALAAGDAAGDELARLYWRLRAGLGIDKDPARFGAFPSDPYSHSPMQRGAQQPGMTGQVKEEILARAGELGLEVAGGRLGFVPSLLRDRELATPSRSVRLPGPAGDERQLGLPKGSLLFSCCAVPVVYRRGEAARVTVVAKGGDRRELEGSWLDERASRAVFARSGEVERLEVELPPRA